MKPVLKIGMAIVAAAALASCAGMQRQSVSTLYEPPLGGVAAGSTLAIERADITLSSSRSEFDLRGVSVTVTAGDSTQTIELGGRYLETDDDWDLGEVGVLDTNIFKKSGVDARALGVRLSERLLAGITGAADLRLPINRAYPDAGEYSSRKITYDYTVTPYAATVDEASAPLAPIFSASPSPVNSDYRLAVSVDIRSEILEILADYGYNTSSFGILDRKPAMGDYYLTYKAYVEFSLVDARTGDVLMTEKTEQALPLAYVEGAFEYVPVKNKDAAAFSTFFRSYDFTAAAEALVDRVADNLVPAFRPVYYNSVTWVKVEE
ncbi:MAG: hypothetical protein JXA15_04165 [Spirochaetales bacterium]|nr:hypothetical protein [Spirochaetales bacterium]